MGPISKGKILILIVCLGLTSLFVHRQPQAGAVAPETSLNEALGRIDGWRNSGVIPLSSQVVEELDLDDYLFQTFSNDLGSVTLYVGYYHSAKKVGAAHDPMVCYPGQGWKLSHFQEGESQIKGTGGTIVSYSTMIAEQDGRKELVLYWFQASDQATSGTLAQKVALLKQRLMNGSENNAFVRVSTSLQDRSAEDARALILSFLNNFYPKFFRYATGS